MATLEQMLEARERLGSYVEAARELGLHESTVRRKIKKAGCYVTRDYIPVSYEAIVRAALRCGTMKEAAHELGITVRQAERRLAARGTSIKRLRSGECPQPKIVCNDEILDAVHATTSCEKAGNLLGVHKRTVEKRLCWLGVTPEQVREDRHVELHPGVGLSDFERKLPDRYGAALAKTGRRFDE